jgi:hypothetical protein
LPETDNWTTAQRAAGVFLAAGALLFMLFGLAQEPAGEETKRILVEADDAQRLSAQFSRTWMRPPTRTEING